MFRLFKHYMDFPSIVLASFEIGILFILILTLGRTLGEYGVNLRRDDAALAATLITLCATVGMISVGMYSREFSFHWRQAASRALVILPLVLLFLVLAQGAFDTLTHSDGQSGYYMLYAVGLTAFFPLLVLIRSLFIVVVDQTGMFKRRVLVIGSGHRAGKIETLCREHDDRSYSIVGYVHFGEPMDAENLSHDNRRNPERRRDFWMDPHKLAAFCVERKIDEVVVASTERRGMPVRDLLACKLNGGLRVTEYASFWERESGQVDLEEISPSWLVFSDGFHMTWVRAFIKRAFDIAVSALLLLLTLPITLTTALLIRLESPGPVFYRQERVGLHGKTFMILKFRSMRVDAEKDGPRWAAKNDSRVTRVGAFIRKVRIDEIPQVINVLRNEMSFVGPRPERPVFVNDLGKKIPYYNERHTAKPGITGWAQINYPYGATEEDTRHKLAYDLYYVKNGSLFLDIIIITQTVKVLLWNSGAR